MNELVAEHPLRHRSRSPRRRPGSAAPTCRPVQMVRRLIQRAGEVTVRQLIGQPGAAGARGPTGGSERRRPGGTCSMSSESVGTADRQSPARVSAAFPSWCGWTGAPTRRWPAHPCWSDGDRSRYASLKPASPESSRPGTATINAGGPAGSPCNATSAGVNRELCGGGPERRRRARRKATAASSGGQFENMERALVALVPLALGLILVFFISALAGCATHYHQLWHSRWARMGDGGVMVRGMPFTVSAGVRLHALSGVAIPQRPGPRDLRRQQLAASARDARPRKAV